MTKKEIKELEEFYLKYADHISDWSQHHNNIIQLSSEFIKEFSSEISIVSLITHALDKKLNALQFNHPEPSDGYIKHIKKLLKLTNGLSTYFEDMEIKINDFPIKEKELITHLCGIDNPSLLKDFKEAGLDLNHKKYPAIVFCADTKSVKNIEFLIKEKCDINAQIMNNGLFSSLAHYSSIPDGVTALMLSCLVKNRTLLFRSELEADLSLYKKCMRTLINAGADIKVKDSNGQGIYHYLLSGMYAMEKVKFFEEITKNK